MGTSEQCQPPVPAAEAFDHGEVAGEVAAPFAPVEAAELERICDPGSARESIHWGRNYLYVMDWRSAAGTVPVVVKQFRNAGLKARLRRKMRGTKASRAFAVARRLQALGVGTPAPQLYADSKDLEGPAWFVSEHLEGKLEARYLLRSLDAASAATDYPELDPAAVFQAFGRLARRLHDGGVWHRDLTCGNLLIEEQAFARGTARSPDDISGLWLLDLNRAHIGARVSLWRRMRDLGRLEIPRELMPSLWSGYWKEEDGRFRRWLGQGLRSASLAGFLWKNRSKSTVRGFGRRLADVFLPRRKAHAHIPETKERSAREKIVWDRLSDQPHQHASKWEKARVRALDFPEHLGFLLSAGLAATSVRRRSRELESTRFAEPRVIEGLGVCVRPWPEAPQAVPEMLGELDVRHALLRLHPWEEDFSAELELAETVVGKGIDLAFALPQDRSLVRDPELWRRRVRALARAFAPLGNSFQVGQAPNRSKWGIWKPSEYARLFEIAAEEIRAVREDVVLLGPSVIDFEFHQTLGYLHRRFDGRHLSLDGLASLLYVDRRGAPENEQMGLDTVGKVAWLRAMADTAPVDRKSAPSDPLVNWITEVNWPLWEGPHSPAGRDVAVDEATQAAYLVRYYLQVLASGFADRVYWWQLIAKGYGLVDWADRGDGVIELRRRPSFRALQVLVGELQGTNFVGEVGTAGDGQRLLRFERPDGSTVVVGWAVSGASTVDLPEEVEAVRTFDGEWEGQGGGRRARLEAMPKIFRLHRSGADAIG